MHAEFESTRLPVYGSNFKGGNFVSYFAGRKDEDQIYRFLTLLVYDPCGYRPEAIQTRGRSNPEQARKSKLKSFIKH